MQSYSPDPLRIARADIAACMALLRDGSRTFLAASRLLPADVCEAACALYAFCRLADDEVDGPAGSSVALSRMRIRLDRVCGGDPDDFPADRALSTVVARYGIPRDLLDALLQGFEWDIDGRRYNTLFELHSYAARVAGSVGAMMALIMGVTDPQAVARACELGVAMQLSNIARDVGDDARANRLYLPRDWLHEVGIDPEQWMLSPCFDPALGSVIRRLLNEADTLYARASKGIAMLPWRCRSAIQMASVLYAEIGHEVARRGYDSISGRAVVAPHRKVLGSARALAGLAFLKAGNDLPVMDATRFLLDPIVAAHGSTERFVRASGIPWYRFDRHAEWTLDLFERLGQRDRTELSRGYGATLRTSGGTGRALAP